MRLSGSPRTRSAAPYSNQERRPAGHLPSAGRRFVCGVGHACTATSIDAHVSASQPRVTPVIQKERVMRWGPGPPSQRRRETNRPRGQRRCASPQGSLAPVLAARESPGHRTDLIERAVHLFDLRAGEIPVRHRELKSGSHLLSRAARRRESRPRRPSVVPVGLGDIEYDAIHRPMNLIEERLVALANQAISCRSPPAA